tara:strand:+ start:66022 stop:66480 length:459 start_codon:yes stop_codon:yes gene_type:complete
MDTSTLENIAEDYISHRLQRSGMLVAKPKNDRLGTDLLVFDEINDGVKFCRVQAKGSEQANLFIKRAILERSKRKWEFVWRGFKISAPVLDDHFYSDFFAHKITLAPGDQLEVKLKIYQSKDEDTGIYSNDRYEVTEVMKHIPHITQIEILS